MWLNFRTITGRSGNAGIRNGRPNPAVGSVFVREDACVDLGPRRNAQNHERNFGHIRTCRSSRNHIAAERLSTCPSSPRPFRDVADSRGERSNSRLAGHLTRLAQEIWASSIRWKSMGSRTSDLGQPPILLWPSGLALTPNHEFQMRFHRVCV